MTLEDLCNEIGAIVVCGDGEDVISGVRRLRARIEEYKAELGDVYDAIGMAKRELDGETKARRFAEARLDETRRLLRDRDAEIVRLSAVIRADPERRDGEYIRKLRDHVELNGTLLREARDTAAILTERCRDLENALRAFAALELERLGRLGDEAARAVLRGEV